MGKKQVMITLDEETHKKAKEKMLNISGECEKALQSRCIIPDVDFNDDVNCSVCGRKGNKETKDTVKDKDPNAITWLWPAEQWICNRCLKEEILKVHKY